jgi:OOP family OmpA-OmpF porin
MKPYILLSIIIFITIFVTPAFSGQRLNKNGVVYHGHKISVTQFKDCYGAIVDIETGVITDEDGECPPVPLLLPHAPLPEKTCPTLSIGFDFGSAEINPENTSGLSKLSKFMLVYPFTTAIIEGHGDNRESFELSELRAENVKHYLVDKYGIARNRLTTVGYGYTKPIATNKSSIGRQKNRRIEVMLDCSEREQSQN